MTSSSARVENVEELDKTTLVSFSAQTCTIPLHIKERAYRIFILSSTNMSSCIMMVIWMDQTNCSALSLLPSKLSSLAALEPLDEWLPVGMFIRIACPTADAAFCVQDISLGLHGTVLESIVGCLELGELLRLVMENFT